MDPCVQLKRGEQTVMLFRDPLAFTLLSVIAYRARRTENAPDNGLVIGEAMMGDHENYGMTRGQYREALGRLVRLKYATTRTTNRGLIVKLINTDILNPNFEDNNHQSNQPTTSQQSNHANM